MPEVYRPSASVASITAPFPRPNEPQPSSVRFFFSGMASYDGWRPCNKPYRHLRRAARWSFYRGENNSGPVAAGGVHAPR